MSVLDSIQVIDNDTHVNEPPDVWTARMSSKKWGDLVPHVVTDEASGLDMWMMGGQPSWPAGGGRNLNGRRSSEMPDIPRGQADNPAGWDPNLRLKWMDEHGIYAQVMYSNIALFRSGTMHQASGVDAELLLETIRVYNDFQTDWASADPKRLLPMTQLPFWDLDESIKELARCAAKGHHGVVFSQEPAAFGLPALIDRHWDPLWAAAQDAGLAVNFHILTGSGFSDPVKPSDGGTDQMSDQSTLLASLRADPVMYVATSVGYISGNMRTFSHLICGGVCDRFPRLNFVGVESGVGWIPFFLESMEWQWHNNGAATKRYDLTPTDYFKRQMYGCFWFEDPIAHAAIELIGPDNFLYETDFPHPTCMCPGEGTIAVSPAQWLRERWSDVPDETLRKVLHDNAARIYHLS
jgi:predicted TIM-barrel fold metal-dependent hydrolase